MSGRTVSGLSGLQPAPEPDAARALAGRLVRAHRQPIAGGLTLAAALPFAASGLILAARQMQEKAETLPGICQAGLEPGSGP